VNSVNIFHNSPRRKRSQGHHQYTSPELHDASKNDMISFVQKPLEMHHIRTKQYSLPLSKLNSLYITCKKSSATDPYSTLYKLTAFILDIGQCSVFKPVTIRENEKKNQPLIPLFFANKGLEAIYLGNKLHHKSVRAMSPPYFKDQSLPIFSHIYTSHITHTISNYKNDD
jgi:hypothetical protein